VPVTDPTAPDPATASSCPWCGAPAATEATNCQTCGAALAQRESIGDLQIVGLTSVDPALQDFDNRPLHLRGPSPTQGVAPALIVGAMAGGPIGLAAIGGVAAVAAAEYIGAAGGGGGTRPEDVGRPSEVVLQALQRLDAEQSGSAAADGAATGGAAPDGAATNGAAVDDGRSIWRDLPRPSAAAAEDSEEATNGGS
jgi:hypothetical protein